MEQKPLNPVHQAALRTPITTADNNKLFWKHWKPSGPVKAHVTFVHGQSEHCSRYDDIFARFAEKGIEVICFDLRGHGMSSGVRGHSPFGPTHSDIDMFFDMADKSVPHFVYGHSMGGLMVASWVLARKKLAAANISPFPNISGVIITGALFKLVNPVPGLGYAARFLALFSPTGTMSNGVKADTITRDKEEVAKYSHDAFNHGLISFQTGDNIFYWTEQIPKVGNTFDVPVLLIHGEKDQITHPKGSQEFYDKIGSSDKTIKIFPEAFHEVHNELKETREECLSLIENWILDRLKPKAEAVEKPAATEEKKEEITEEKKETN